MVGLIKMNVQNTGIRGGGIEALPGEFLAGIHAVANSNNQLK